MTGVTTVVAGNLFNVAFLAYLLYRQRQVRRVPSRLVVRTTGVFALIGVVLLTQYLGQAPKPEPASWLALGGSFVVGAGLAVARAYTVRLWFAEHLLLRQGTWLTVGLWLVAFGVHALAGLLVRHLPGGFGLESATGMLYLAMSSLIQQAVLVQRGRRMRDAHHRAGIENAAGRR
jgi:hypothetical protein